MKKTLLEIVQSIMNDMDSDAVNSISDTIESQQIAQTVRTVYESMVSNRDWPHLNRLDTLVSVSDTNTPHYLRLPEDTKELHWLRYNVRDAADTKDKYEEVRYLYPEDFMDVLNGRNETESNVTEYTHSSGVQMKIRTDKEPTYWTTFNDDVIVMDSYDSAVDTTLQGSKTQAFISKIPTWSHSDTFIPDLPPQAFSLLLAESKSVYWNSLKQQPNAKEEQRASRQRANLNQQSHRISRGEKTRKYGRRSRK